MGNELLLWSDPVAPPPVPPEASTEPAEVLS